MQITVFTFYDCLMVVMSSQNGEFYWITYYNLSEYVKKDYKY